MLYTLIVASSWLLIILGVLLTVFQFNPRHHSYVSIPSPLAWFIQELPSIIIPFLFYFHPPQQSTDFGLFSTGLLLIHFVYRSFVYPFLIDWQRFHPLWMVMLVFSFSTWNSFIQCGWNAFLQPEWRDSEQNEWIFYLGVSMFFIGLLIHIVSDIQLFSVRQFESTVYPSTYLFSSISGPHYFGECIEWIGYALVTRSFPAIAFAIFTVCNLSTKARINHTWCQKNYRIENFYGKTSLVPFFW